MKAFNLEDALAGKSVVTRDGKTIKQIAYFPDASPYSVAAITKGTGCVGSYTKYGKYFHGDKDSMQDLFMASTKKTGFVNIYRENITKEHLVIPNRSGHAIHPDVETAHRLRNDAKEHIAVVEISWEE